jgi:hypothetical protein
MYIDLRVKVLARALKWHLAVLVFSRIGRFSGCIDFQARQQFPLTTGGDFDGSMARNLSRRSRCFFVEVVKVTLHDYRKS